MSSLLQRENPNIACYNPRSSWKNCQAEIGATPWCVYQNQSMSFYPSFTMGCFSAPSPIPRKVITIHTPGLKQTPSPKHLWELLTPSSFAGTTGNELRFWTNQQRKRTTNSGTVLIFSNYPQNAPHNQFTSRFSVDSVSLPCLMVFSSD